MLVHTKTTLEVIQPCEWGQHHFAHKDLTAALTFCIKTVLHVL